MNASNLEKARKFALEINAIKRNRMFEGFIKTNEPISSTIFDISTAKIALAMLCLGEASKWSTKHRGFCLGNSDHRIILLFLKLLRICFPSFDIEKVRCTVQCRADQDIHSLEEYWHKITGVPLVHFYKARVDARTVGKPTLKTNYRGVLRVDYFDTKIHLELESLADLVYNQLAGPVV